MRYVLAAGAFVLALLGAPAFAQSSSVLGSWAMVAQTPGGAMPATLTFSEEGGVHTVVVEDVPYPGYEPVEGGISEVVVDGSAFSFKRKMNSPEGPFDVSYSGTVDGDTLTGELNSSFGPMPISGTRK